jgi:hypothetical protein
MHVEFHNLLSVFNIVRLNKARGMISMWHSWEKQEIHTSFIWTTGMEETAWEIEW